MSSATAVTFSALATGLPSRSGHFAHWRCARLCSAPARPAMQTPRTQAHGAEPGRHKGAPGLAHSPAWAARVAGLQPPRSARGDSRRSLARLHNTRSGPGQPNRATWARAARRRACAAKSAASQQQTTWVTVHGRARDGGGRPFATAKGRQHGVGAPSACVSDVSVPWVRLRPAGPRVLLSGPW